MCLIAFAAQDRGQIPDNHLAWAHARNDDSWGIMFPEDGHVRLLRDVSDHAAFCKAWNGSPRQRPIAAHFRYFGANTYVFPPTSHPCLAGVKGG